mmetsp:Transcript_31365/g.49110  ORF Transcript_31365/g.49110 Transcript_31365/m.49110 type:complete len:225 (-) Transcript_31365:10-684(-)
MLPGSACMQYPELLPSRTTSLRSTGQLTPTIRSVSSLAVESRNSTIGAETAMVMHCSITLLAFCRSKTLKQIEKVRPSWRAMGVNSKCLVTALCTVVLSILLNSTKVSAVRVASLGSPGLAMTANERLRSLSVSAAVILKDTGCPTVKLYRGSGLHILWEHHCIISWVSVIQLNAPSALGSWKLRSSSSTKAPSPGHLHPMFFGSMVAKARNPQSSILNPQPST